VRIPFLIDAIVDSGRSNHSIVALAYILHKTPNVFPIIGGRKIEHLEQNIEGLGIALAEEQVTFLESEAPEFDIGFPASLIVSYFAFPPCYLISFNSSLLDFRETGLSNSIYLKRDLISKECRMPNHSDLPCRRILILSM
jgi:hypothetical protein